MLGQLSMPADSTKLQPKVVNEAKPLVQGSLATSRGHCLPFGATPHKGGVNFAIISRHAQAVHLVLFNEGQEEPIAEFPLHPGINKTGDVWHIYVHGLSPGARYGYRVQGPFAPKLGHRFNPRVVVLDPYARAICGASKWGVADQQLNQNKNPGDLTRRSRVVSEEDFDWGTDVPPATPMSQTVIYELHVRGFTRHSSSGVQYPGTFLGIVEKIPYLKALGVTAVELMPILEFNELDHEHYHPDSGEQLRNYWGYSSLSFFAPKASYAAHPNSQVREFKEMVKALHNAGLEVILDVVYNHTCEGNEHGPTLSFRGLDNAIYYLLDKEGRYYNFSGCGNTVNCNHPIVRDLVIDSLVYLVSELHVDGFRFDLASILGRGPEGKVLEDPPLLRHIAEHPVLAGTKLLAEAWDAAGLYQLGKFPAWGRWAELNGSFRDDVRRFLRSDSAATAGVARRICGSLDLYGEAERHPYHSVNFVTCHDGFTLNDLVSYNTKHNLANGESNCDGWNENYSFNCGQEGVTDSAQVNALRQRQMRNFLTLLFISQGVPFLLQGDEFARTQQGNNNAYCQDNEISWVDWTFAKKNSGLVRFTQMMIALRKKYFALTREQFGNRVSWHGTKLAEPDWGGQKRTLAFHLQGTKGEPSFYFIFNAHWEWQRFNLPLSHGQLRWRRLVDTNLKSPEDIVEEFEAVVVQPSDHYVLAPRSAVVLLS